MKLHACIILLGLNATLFAQSSQQPDIGGCNIFPSNNIWNTRIDALSVDPNGVAYINTEGGSSTPLHPDFGTVWNGAPNGWPYVAVPSTQPFVPIVFTEYGSESDPGPYPVPPDAAIEGGATSTGDRHVLVVQSGTCKLYELFAAYPQADGSWQAAGGAVFDLTVNDPLRPAGWTSADAAGLPITPGLVRYDEVQQAISGDGMLHHALRFTVANSQAAYVWPARHYGSPSTNPAFSPMGERFRLKASTNITIYPGTTTPVSAINQVILQTLKTYGMFVADNGGSFYVSGTPDTRWDDADLHSLGYYTAADFEAVDESSLMLDPNSGEALEIGLPTIPLIAPLNNAIVSGTTTLAAKAPSGVSVASVQFNLDGSTVLGTATAASTTFSLPWQTTSVPNGPHTVTAVATNSQGITSTSIPISVTVSNSSTPAANATYLTTDTTTCGNWPGSYGSEGAIIPLDSSRPPTYSSVQLSSGTQTWNWTDADPRDPRALLRYHSNIRRIASAFYEATGFSIDINFTDGLAHRLSAYFLDFDRQGRTQTITIRNAASGVVLDTRSLSNFGNGEYLSWEV